jgi:hypothetical protein
VPAADDSEESDPPEDNGDTEPDLGWSSWAPNWCPWLFKGAWPYALNLADEGSEMFGPIVHPTLGLFKRL